MAERMPSLVVAHEIAELLNVSRQRVTQLAGAADFPPPVDELRVGRIWKKADVIEWARSKGRLVDDLDEG